MKNSQEEPLTAEEEALCKQLRDMATGQPTRLDTMQREKLTAHFRDSEATQRGRFGIWAWLTPTVAACAIVGFVMLQLSRQPETMPVAPTTAAVALTPAVAEAQEETVDYLAWDSWESATSRVQETYWLTQSVSTSTLGDSGEEEAFNYDFSDTTGLLDSGSRQRLSQLRSELEVGI